MPVEERTWKQIRAFHAMYGHDYAEFLSLLQELVEMGKVPEAEIDDIKRKFPNKSPPPPPPLEEEEGVEIYLKNPPDSAPLRELPFKGWVQPVADDLRVSPDSMRTLLGFGEDDVLEDIQENALHILDGCNNPTDNGAHWGENRRGLVYGMVQSGKTASMVTMINLGRRAGYRLFIILAGDKSSLRDQTQDRVNQAFNLQGGINHDKRIFSPTFATDFRQTTGGYSQNFLLDRHAIGGQDWTIIIVMKKQTNHLNSIVAQFEDLINEVENTHDKDVDALYPTMIFDDEADYASQNTDVEGDGTTIHNDILLLRNTIPHNCYIAYTATPQANLSANIHSEIGYPKDFWWMLEPFMDKDQHGQFRPRTYLGAHEVFVDYETYLLHRMGRNEWPHHEKTAMGRPRGVYYPAYTPTGIGEFSSRIIDLERQFLEEIINDQRDMPAAILNGLVDYLLSCGVRWFRNWESTGTSLKPSLDEIVRSKEYDFHAMMVHLSLKQENQEMIREVVGEAWPMVVEHYNSFDPETSDDSNFFTNRWRLQCERTMYFQGSSFLPWSEVNHFINKAVEITTEPIFDHRGGSPYSLHEGEPWIYLLNSSDVGMELNYGSETDRQIRTKKASIVVGGNILSRGLTINGLSVTVFGRTAGFETMDTVLQRGRWFGHKMKEADLICIHLQDEPREVFRQIAEADQYLRRQIKLSLRNGLTPLQVLLELRNSPFFAPTSKAKSSFLAQSKGFGFSGKRALLDQPSFEISDIIHNQTIIDELLVHVREPVHGRAKLRKDIDPDIIIDALLKFRCDDGASQVSYKVYGEYLKDWRDRAAAGQNPQLPNINVAIMNGVAKRQRRLKTTSHPSGPKQAQDEVTTRFGPIVGGMNDPKTYMGDAFLDYPESWHLTQKGAEKMRDSTEDILIVFYRLDPNYIRKTWWDTSQKSATQPHGKRVTDEIRIPADHDLYIDGDRPPRQGGHRNPVYVFAAWTPSGGPMYNVGVNSLIDPSNVEQIGMTTKSNEVTSDDEQ